MLADLIRELLKAQNATEKEKAYRKLEKVGMDRLSADICAKEMRKWDARVRS